MTQSQVRRRRPEELRNLLVEAAVAQFAERGYAGTTNRNIAEAAGVSESALYRHFASKSELFCEAVLAPLVEFLDRWRTWTRPEQGTQGFEDMMRRFVGEMYTAMAAHRGALRGVAATSGDLPPDVRATLREAFDNLFEQLHVLAIVEAQRHNWYSSDGLEPVGRVMLAAVLGMVTFDWLLDPADQATGGQQLVDVYAQLACWGFARQPPANLDE